MTLVEAVTAINLLISAAVTPYDNLEWVPVQDVLALSLVGYHEMREFKHNDQCELLAMTTVLTRASHEGWPDSVVQVVRQRHQFSPKIRHGLRAITNTVAWRRSVRLAIQAYTKPNVAQQLPVLYPTHFHLVGEKPSWAKSKKLTYLGRACNSEWYRRI